MSMPMVHFIVFAVIGIGIFAGILISFVQNRFTVEPNDRQRIVIRNIVTGNMDVLGPGIHFLAPWWVEFEKVIINREPVEVPKSGDTNSKGEDTRTSDGVDAIIQYRYDIITGRQHLDNGALKNPEKVDDPKITLVKECVISAVTKINYKDRERRVQDLVSAAIEAMMSNYESDELFRPSAHAKDKKKLRVPRRHNSRPGRDKRNFERFDIMPVVIENGDDLYRQLAKCIEAIANEGLTFVGINIVNFKITGLSPKDPAYQTAIEQRQRAERIAEAATVLRAAPGFGAELSAREALVATDPTAFGNATKAQVELDIAKTIAGSIEKVVTGATEAIQKFAEHTADGMKNFGKGNDNNKNP